MNTRRVVIGFALCLLLICYLPCSATPKTWYVKNDGTGDAPTIQAAIDSSSTGDTILVASGTYVQPMIVCYAKNDLTIMSEFGAEQTILQAESSDDPVMFIQSSNYLTVQGLTFENGSSGIYVEAYANNMMVKDNIFCNNEGYGIWVTLSYFVTIRNNLIYSNDGGINCHSAGDFTEIVNNTIAFNYHEASGVGILIYMGLLHSIRNNIISNNLCGFLPAATSINEFRCNNVFGNDQDYCMSFPPDPYGTEGNFSLDPQFCGVSPDVSGNFYLQSDSPCAPDNHTNGYVCGLIGRCSVACGPVSTEEQSWSEIKMKYR